MPPTKPTTFAISSAFAVVAVMVAATATPTMDVTEIGEPFGDDQPRAGDGVTRRTAPFSPDIRFSSADAPFVPPAGAPPAAVHRPTAKLPKASAPRPSQRLMVAMKINEPEATVASIDLDAVAPDAPKTLAPPPAIPRQRRPAAGAIMAAIRAVMPRARVCLQGNEDVTTAVVVFRGDGSVARVDHENECVRGALSHAHVDAFTDPSFATPVTVRR